MTPLEAMRLAITEGYKGTGYVSPNPLVGCVILDKNMNFLASGFHARVGEGHAEVQALRAVANAERLNGAHIFVTLEPCAHEGRTPSCAKTLALLPIASLTYGLIDPNPLVRGQGAEILRQAGKDVRKFNDLQDELTELCEIFLTNFNKNRPFVALKVAMSLDGKIALPDGRSQWITGERSRARAHELRGAYDAIVVGAGTVLKDDPRLNSRDPQFISKAQRVVIFDPDGLVAQRLSSLNLFSVRRPEDIFLITTNPVKTPARQINTPSISGVFDLAEVLRGLNSEGLRSLFIEGGAATYASFLRSELVDRAYIFIAPKILGQGLSWSADFAVQSLEVMPKLKRVRYEELGDDLFLTGLLA